MAFDSGKYVTEMVEWLGEYSGSNAAETGLVSDEIFVLRLDLLRRAELLELEFRTGESFVRASASAIRCGSRSADVQFDERHGEATEMLESVRLAIAELRSQVLPRVEDIRHRISQTLAAQAK